MKVFQYLDDPFRVNDNPYVGTLIAGMKEVAQDVEFGFGVKVFWSDNLFEYEILHIHWPVLLVTKKTTPEKDVELFLDRLRLYKKRKNKIVVTCHNLRPHYCKNPIEEVLYKKVYNLADVMIHLGSYSQKLMEKEYPHVKHVLCFHHTYDSLYSQSEKEYCKKKLHLNSQKKYILCFGDFRDNEERKIVDNISKYFYRKNIEVLAPRYYQIIKRRNFLKNGFQWLKGKYKEMVIPGLHIYGRFVSNELLPYFYGASEIALIQRKEILNSGNLPMGFYFGKVVVGPDIGNVGCILESTGNPTFSPNDDDSIIRAIVLALEMQESGKGISNSQYAKMNFSTSVVCKRLYEIYKDTLNI